MKKHLEKLRAQPDHHKSRIIKTAALVTTGIIVLVYIILRTFGSNQDIAQDGTSRFENFSNIIDASLERFTQVGQDLSEQQDGFREIQEAAIEAELQQENEVDESQSESNEQLINEESDENEVSRSSDGATEVSNTTNE